MKLFKRDKVGIATIIFFTMVNFIVSNSAIAVDSFNFENIEIRKIPKTNAVLSEYIYIPSSLGNNQSQYRRFSLADQLDLRVENQGITNECWAFSVTKSLETNLAINNNTRSLEDFSERHMDYATCRTFLDGINEKGFNKEVGEGGLILEGLAYLTNGQGAVLESQMPFENNEVLVPLNEINKPVDTIVNDYYVFPSISKKYVYDENGNTVAVNYYKADGSEYKKDELDFVRNEIKEHIVTNGAISSMTAGTASQYYNSDKIFSSTAYNCNVEDLDRDHAFTIVGWDDDYSKDNFAEGTKPSTDGAYIVLNSYGENAFNNGYLYVSYEDFYIENEIYGIQSASKIDYDSIYQTDFYGGIYQLGIESVNTGYYGTVFQRDASKNEKISSVGITLSSYANIEIYINPNGSSLDFRNLKKVGESGTTLKPGYHRININPTKLRGNEFAIVIKQTSEDGKFYFSIETAIKDTIYENVTSNNKSYMSSDGSNWTNIKDLEVTGIDVDTTDVCIKAFGTTVELQDEDISSDIYTIDNNYIYNIRFNTDVYEFLNNINTHSEDISLKSSEEIVNSGIIKTGMKLSVNDRDYVLIVKGDINADGNVTLTDLSKLILHYNETRGFELEGDNLKAADMNIDGKVSLVDISQLLVLYNSI